MENQIQHKTLGKIKVLMSFERKKENGDSSPSVIALISSMKIKHISTNWNSIGNVSYSFARRSKNKPATPSYYLMWGVNDNLHESTFSRLFTPSGRKSTLDASIKLFMEAKNATEFVNFSKI